MESRISAARARANRANNVLLGAAAALFVAALVAARIAHPARASQPATSPSSVQSHDQADDGYYDYYGSGSTAPSQSTPQLSSGGS
jgi:hypothetical protein